ncbi:MAG TPA: ABC transporter permease subunit [Acidobacteriota bacterium]|nr:ABC transporter permease subunit [Acidobacteriota bacterium]
MQTILAIWQREMKSYFVSPVAYVVLTVFLFISGLTFIGRLESAVQSTMMLAQLGYEGMPVDIPAYVVQSLFGIMVLMLLFLIPMLTMGLFSEEKKRGTIELLLTTPVGNFQALMGKYLASLTLLLIILASSGITILPLFYHSQPDLKPILAGYLGLFLYGAALLALGIFISTLTENQIVAVIITFGASLLLWLLSIFSGSAVGAAREVLNYLSVIYHLEAFLKGVIDTSHVIYYLTFTFVGLFLAYRSLESMRWKG